MRTLILVGSFMWLDPSVEPGYPVGPVTAVGSYPLRALGALHACD